MIKNLDVAKTSEIDQISAKFLKDDAPVIAIHHANIISACIKLDTFPSKCNVAKIKALFKKGIKTETKNYRPIFGPPALARRVGSLVFSETQHGVRDPCLIVCDRAGFFLKNLFAQKMGKMGQKQGFLNLLENLVIIFF